MDQGFTRKSGMKVVPERRVKDEPKVQHPHMERMPMTRYEPKPVVETMMRVYGFIGGTILVVGVLACRRRPKRKVKSDLPMRVQAMASV